MSTGAMLQSADTLESQLFGLLDKLENLRRESVTKRGPPRPSMIEEVRALELWRSVIAECLATVFYVFLVCGAFCPWVGKTPSAEVQIAISVVSGFSMAVLVHSFGQVSGGHINPAITIAFAATRKVSPLRAVIYVLAQLGGGIAGAALLYGTTSTSHAGDLGATSVSRSITSWQAFGVEFLLTFVVVFVFCASVCPYKRSLGSAAVAIGLAYLATSVVGVYWVGPILGAISASLIYEYIFNPHRSPSSRGDSVDGDSSSVGSEDDAYDECSKPPPRYNYNALRAQQFEHFRSPNPSQTTSPIGYSACVYGQPGATSVRSVPAYKADPAFSITKDEIYSGSKSMYTKSPTPSRSANLNRSQSVCARAQHPPGSHGYSHNLAQSQSVYTKSPDGFASLSRNCKGGNVATDALLHSKPPLVKPEPVYGISPYMKSHQDSADSTYSTYRGSSSYTSSRSSGIPPPVPMSRMRHDALTPNSLISGITTPNSVISYH